MARANGAFVPVYLREDPETGEMQGAFEPQDFEALTQGYGCTVCFADYQGQRLLRCPTCGAPTEARIVPEWWTEHPTIRP